MHNTPLAVTASEPDVPSSGPDKAASTAFGIKRGNRTTADVVHVSIYVCTHISHHPLYAMSFSSVKKTRGEELQDCLIGSKSLAKHALYKWDAAVSEDSRARNAMRLPPT